MYNRQHQTGIPSPGPTGVASAFNPVIRLRSPLMDTRDPAGFLPTRRISARTKGLVSVSSKASVKTQLQIRNVGKPGRLPLQRLLGEGSNRI